MKAKTLTNFTIILSARGLCEPRSADLSPLSLLWWKCYCGISDAHTAVSTLVEGKVNEKSVKKEKRWNEWSDQVSDTLGRYRSSFTFCCTYPVNSVHTIKCHQCRRGRKSANHGRESARLKRPQRCPSPAPLTQRPQKAHREFETRPNEKSLNH